MKLSVVSTMYRSAPFLPEFIERLDRTVKQITDDYEIILVNDGSPDDSLNVALHLQKTYPKIQVVDLSRNFGHHAAIVAGLEHTNGDRVLLMDCDLEEQPEWLQLFFHEMDLSSADVIYGVQKERVAGGVSNLFGTMFWRAINFMSSVKIPHNPMTCRLMKRAYVDALLTIGDKVIFLAGSFAWTGFVQHPIQLTKTPRPVQHRSTYNFSRKLLQVVDSFSSFSVAPLMMVFLMGVVIWMTSVIYGGYLLVHKLLSPEMVMSGFTSLMLSIWFLSGAIIVALGIIGLYIAKVFQEVKGRPLFLVKKIYKGEDHE